MQRMEMMMCILLLFNHLPNANTHIWTHTKCLFVHLRVRKVEIWWTKIDGLIFDSSFALLWIFFLTVVVNHHTSIFLCVVLCFSYFPVHFFFIRDRITSSSRVGTLEGQHMLEVLEIKWRRWNVDGVDMSRGGTGNMLVEECSGWSYRIPRMSSERIWNESVYNGRRCRGEGVREEDDFLWWPLKG